MKPRSRQGIPDSIPDAQVDSYLYWRDREKKHLEEQARSEAETMEEVHRIYSNMRRDMQSHIAEFYAKYAKSEQITLAEARQRVSKMDIEEYGELAARYVADKDFSDLANEQMRLYNATMKINRLEYLKATLGLDMVAGYTDIDDLYTRHLTEMAMEEQKRMSGILHMTNAVSPKVFRRNAEAIAKGSFKGATFSERIWTNQTKMKGILDEQLQRGLMQGKNPRALMQELRPFLKDQQDHAEEHLLTLLQTEMARVQTEAQKMSYEENGIEKYTFICNELDGRTCPVCKDLDGNMYPVKEMMAGENASPIHPRCRCSTAAYMDREAFEKWLEGQDKAGQSIGLSSSGSNQLVEPHDPPKFIRNVLDTEDRKKILSDYEKLIVDSPIENAIVITKDGKLYHCYGTLNGVYPDYDLGEELCGADMTHNHPVGSDNEYSFSESDRSLFFSYELHILRGIDELYEYEFNRDKDDVDEITGSAFDIDEYSFRHQKVIDEARLFGIGYRRKKRE